MKLWRPAKTVTAQPSDVLPLEEVKKNNRRALERFRTALNLDADQTKSFEQILDDYGKYYHTLQSQMAEMRADGRTKMLKILNEEQRKTFTQMGAELEKKAFR